MKIPFLSLVCAFSFIILLSANRLSAQKVEIRSPVSPHLLDTVEIKGYDKDSLIQLAMANPAAVPEPYFRYLYVFGDGNFINGVRDSMVLHQYAKDAGKLLVNGKYKYDVTVYASDIYSGGKPPPDKALLDTVIITKPDGTKDSVVIGDPPKITRNDISLHPVTDKLANFTTIQPVVRPGRYLSLQKNHELRPKDKLVVIASLKNPETNPDLPAVDGQIYLFYNGKVTWSAPAGKSAKAKQPARFGKFDSDTTLIYNRQTWKVVLDTVATGVLDYQRVLVLNYLDLRPNEERHFFFEFTNDDDMLDLIDKAGKDTASVKFLAVATAVDQNQGNGYASVLTPAQLQILTNQKINTYLSPTSQNPLLAAIYNAMLAANFDTVASLPFQGATGGGFPLVLLDMSEVPGKILAAKDPNHLSGYACKCGGAQKIVYDVEFSNDGLIGTTNVFVNLKLPPELDINTIADTTYFPLPSGSGHVILEQVAPDEVRFHMKNYGILPTADWGYGHPNTIGRITFSILSKTGVSIENVPPVQACIRFESPTVEAVCTNFAGVFLAADSINSPAVQAILQCQKCPWYCVVCDLLNIQQTWLCILVLVVVAVLVVLLFWLLKKLF